MGGEPRNDGSRARSGRFAALDAAAVNQDGFLREEHAAGLVTMSSPADPEPSLRVEDGVVVELDGRPAAEFDVIDEFLAAHGIDLAVAAEAMALEPVQIARMLVDINVPREEVVRIARGLTPAALARAVALLRPAETVLALTKMRARRTPSNQAHVTNRLDDPLLIAADAATAVAFGFRELETTVPVLGDAPCNALAMLVGSQVAAAGALTQCSIEESQELLLGLRGLTTYAETISLYGTEQVFVDGDDTPFSKAFLASAYASRGLKLRVTSGAGAEVLMGAAEGCSMLYLEARCVKLAWAIGAQGVQNGAIEGINIAGALPRGMAEAVAENLMVMMCGLESCSGNDTLMSQSDVRRTAHVMPIFLAGSDFLFSGFGSVTAYDNMFGPSNFNGDDLDDYLVLQRDWGVDGGLRPVDEPELLDLRRRAATAVRDVLHHLGLASFDDARIEAVVGAHGSKDLEDLDPQIVVDAAQGIVERPVTAVEVVAALAATGHAAEAERVMAMLHQRLLGTYLQTAAVLDEEMNVLSARTDPNDYRGPGTGYQLAPARQAEIDGIRQARTRADLLGEFGRPLAGVEFRERGEAQPAADPREVAIGVSPSFAAEINWTLSGQSVWEALRQILAGIEEEECVGRVIKVRHTIDVGLIGLTAARLSGSGIGVGLQAKGTVLIHRRDLPPLANLELLSVAPVITAEMYRTVGQNAARHVKGAPLKPLRNPYTEETIGARYHASTVGLVAIERAASRPGAAPVDLEVVR
ncbi:MAG: propanediol/glycerol family dehydratase large subunit [Actinobacteria bacterium]|nr:propanediol/glycerol family dehydratase large subunit [Actinomycetota bacterium]